MNGRTPGKSRDSETAASSRRRLLVIATVEIPTDRDWTTERMERDVQGALTDYGYFVVRAAVEPIPEAAVGTPL